MTNRLLQIITRKELGYVYTADESAEIKDLIRRIRNAFPVEFGEVFCDLEKALDDEKLKNEILTKTNQSANDEIKKLSAQVAQLQTQKQIQEAAKAKELEQKLRDEIAKYKIVGGGDPGINIPSQPFDPYKDVYKDPYNDVDYFYNKYGHKYPKW